MYKVLVVQKRLRGTFATVSTPALPQGELIKLKLFDTNLLMNSELMSKKRKRGDDILLNYAKNADIFPGIFYKKISIIFIPSFSENAHRATCQR